MTIVEITTLFVTKMCFIHCFMLYSSINIQVMVTPLYWIYDYIFKITFVMYISEGYVLYMRLIKD